MITWICVSILASLLVVGLGMARRAGINREKSEALTETLRDIQNANKPVTDAERERLRGKYRRD